MLDEAKKIELAEKAVGNLFTILSTILEQIQAKPYNERLDVIRFFEDYVRDLREVHDAKKNDT